MPAIAEQSSLNTIQYGSSLSTILFSKKHKPQTISVVVIDKIGNENNEPRDDMILKIS